MHYGSSDQLNRKIEKVRLISRKVDAVLFLTAVMLPLLNLSFSGGQHVPTSAVSEFPLIEYTADYLAGERDAYGNFVGGTETMNLVAHGGRLYAGVGYWMDLPYAKNKEGYPWTGAQVLVKDSIDSPWRLEHNLGQQTLRVDSMKSVTFTTDWKGNKLSKPVSMLVASSTDFLDKGLWVWVRDDNTATWKRGNVTRSEQAQYGRSFALYNDRITKIDFLFVGTSLRQIFRGSYDPDFPGLIRWNSLPEFTANTTNGRAMAFTIANSDLYASVANALYKRNDGRNPGWSPVYQWEPPVQTIFPDMRGLTTIENPEGGGEVILGAREVPGVIERIDPSKGHKVTLELDVRKYFANLWKGFNRSATIIAYNNMLSYTIPSTGEGIHLISLQVHNPDRQYDKVHGVYLVRRQDGSYLHLEVNDARLKNHPEMRAIRSFEFSPFDPNEFYLGGFDCNGLEAHNTAWIFRARVASTYSTTRSVSLQTMDMITHSQPASSQRRFTPLLNWILVAIPTPIIVAVVILLAYRWKKKSSVR